MKAQKTIDAITKEASKMKKRDGVLSGYYKEMTALLGDVDKAEKFKINKKLDFNILEQVFDIFEKEPQLFRPPYFATYVEFSSIPLGDPLKSDKFCPMGLLVVTPDEEESQPKEVPEEAKKEVTAIREQLEKGNLPLHKTPLHYLVHFQEWKTPQGSFFAPAPHIITTHLIEFEQGNYRAYSSIAQREALAEPFDKNQWDSLFENAHEMIPNTLSLFNMFCWMLKCNNIYIKDNPPSSLESRLRKQQKKKPMFAYKTLHIKTDPKTINTQKRQIPSHHKRRHLRRGHIRTYKTGMKIWVRQCMAGQADLGTVMKDYQL